ncbi:hypothetical protein DID88_010274 [Monilinia fructigena]|uniref:60S ribosomal export protein NMD3 n=1 Tax=Monilinia fructigena TaxID=38457 RepID=A0A395ILP0_9HELO|nr:hypothetical protein DID88_010274 [Monilinia fructigena]
MDVDDAPVSIASRFQTQEPKTGATILCCNCGAPIDGTTSAGALCYDCVKLTVDVSQGIQREATVHFCRDCERWLLPPQTWIQASLESRELLALCLKKLRGLHKVRIIDASFIWTEPHSRRIKVKLTIQDSVSEGVVLQQTFEVEYVVAYQQCPDCAKSYTANTWRACVQVRQKVPHKRTFLYLEQLILKHGAHKDTINIKEVKDGLDFFFAAQNSAEKFVDFLSSVAPVTAKEISGTHFHGYSHVYQILQILLFRRAGTNLDDGMLAEATVARASDLGFTQEILLWDILMTGTNFNNPQYDALEESNNYSSKIPDVMLVKKLYARKKKSKNRNWRLKRMGKEEGEVLPRKQDQEKMDRDYEMFLQDVEEDPELRQTLALYKAQKAQKESDAMSVAETSDGEDETPQIDMNELLDEFDELNMQDNQ